MIIGDGGQGPGDKRGIAVLAIHVRMDILGADAEAFGQFRLEAGRVQRRAGADDPAFRNPGNLVEHVGQHIHRVGDDQIYRVGGVRHNLRRDILQDVHIGLRQLQPRLAGLSGDAGGDDDNVGALRLRIVAAADDGRGTERDSLDVYKRQFRLYNRE